MNSQPHYWCPSECENEVIHAPSLHLSVFRQGEDGALHTAPAYDQSGTARPEEECERFLVRLTGINKATDDDA